LQYVVIENLTPNTDEENLVGIFNGCGNIKSIIINRASSAEAVVKILSSLSDLKGKDANELAIVIPAEYVGNDAIKSIGFQDGVVVSPCIVTFDANGHGTAPASQTVGKGHRANEPENPTAEGYEFGGWYKEATCTNEYYFLDEDVEQDNMTLYAKWTAEPYTLTFDVNGGNALITNTLSATYDSAYGTLPSATRTGYVFDGWFTAADSGTQVKADTVCKGDLTVYAHWTVVHTVTFDVNGGNALSESSIQVAQSEAYGTLPSPERTGYTFDGWYTSASGGTEIKSTDVCSNAITLYAHWSKEQYTITFDLNGGEGTAPASMSVSYNATYSSLPASPSRTGYNFAGWYTSASGGTKIENTSICTSAGTLYAHWTAKPYTLTFDVNGGNALTTNTLSATYDAAYGTLPSATRTGYVFDGWFTSADSGTQVKADTVCKGDLTVYAHWSKVVTPAKQDVSNANKTKNNEAPQEPSKSEYDEKIDKLTSDINSVPANGKQTVYLKDITTLSLSVMKMIKNHPNVNLDMTYTYMGVAYHVVIPGGTSVVADENIPWYGPLWLYSKYGAGTVSTVNTTTNSAKGIVYIVQKGDTLSKIAARQSISLKELLNKNPQIKNKDKIAIGDKINL